MIQIDEKLEKELRDLDALSRLNNDIQLLNEDLKSEIEHLITKFKEDFSYSLQYDEENNMNFDAHIEELFFRLDENLDSENCTEP